MSESWYDFLGSEARLRKATYLRIAEDRRHDALMETLALAVPLWMLDLYYRTPEQRCAIARRCSQVLAERADNLMFGNKKKGETAQVFNALAEGLAVAAYQPGGVTFAGRHWCTDHGRCERASAGLPDEPHPDATTTVPGVVNVAPAGEWADAL